MGNNNELQELINWLVEEMGTRSGEFFYSTRSGFWYASLPISNQDQNGIQGYILAQSENLEECLKNLKERIEVSVGSVS